VITVQNYTIKVFPHSDYDAYHKTVNSNVDAPVPLDTQARRKWWCFDNPNGGAFAVAMAGDKVAATCYLSGKSLVLSGTSYKAYEIGETATAPEHQRKGLFSKLVKACTSYAFEEGAVAVYGTPNAQSTPGYAKLKFDIIDDPRSHLFLLPNITGFIAPKSTDELGGFQNKPFLSKNSYQIQTSEFFDHAKNRIRLNIFSDNYFQWRFSGLSASRYRYYRRGEFSMAVRESHLGKYKVLMVSDFGYGNEKPNTFDAAKEIRKIFNHEFIAHKYHGIYFSSERDNLLSHFRYGLKRIIHHRSLPICIMTNQDSNVIKKLRSIALPQLSDCDIG
jgi:GNAT superfamily N-acetyltransferase